MTNCNCTQPFDLTHWKRAVLMLAVTLCSVLALAQSSITVSTNVLFTEPRGGLEYTVPDVGGSLRTTLLYEQQTSKRIGFYAHGAYGHKWMSFLYPLYSLCADQNGLYICVFTEAIRQDKVFGFVETSFGGTVCFGRIVRIRMGPYLAYNGIPTNQNYIPVDEQMFYPASAQDMYGRLELGGQAQLSLVLPLGKHWSIQANGFLARSFSDLRTDKWADARALLINAMGEIDYVEMTSKRLINRYRSFGLSIGYTW
ncbi:MAG: hypothetical protein ACFCUH_11410 [Flavobacteriales bacterium]